MAHRVFFFVVILVITLPASFGAGAGNAPERCATYEQATEIRDDVTRLSHQMAELRRVAAGVPKWRLVKPCDVQQIIQLGVTIKQTNDASRGGLVISGQVNNIGCGKGPGSGSVIFIRGDWTQVRYTQEFRGSASCWYIFGTTATKHRTEYGFGHPGVVNNMEDFNVTKGDGIFNELHMNTKHNNGNTFDGDIYRCDNDQDNFWHSNNGQGLRRATVMLRRHMTEGPAGISTETSCGTPSYVIKDVYVLV